MTEITQRLQDIIDHVIKRAPHAQDCVLFDLEYFGPLTCSCFKDDLRLAMAEAYGFDVEEQREERRAYVHDYGRRQLESGRRRSAVIPPWEPPPTDADPVLRQPY